MTYSVPASLRVALLIAGALLAACKSEQGQPVGPITPPPPVTPRVPTASFTAAATVDAFAPVTFDASASTSTDSSALQYVWDFGGGQRGGGRTITRSFGTGGSRTVTLTVFDGANRSASTTRSVSVNAAPTATATVTADGVVKAPDGTPISGVTISQLGGAPAATTDTAGKARVSLGTNVPLTLRFTKSGLADQILSLRLPATTGADAYFEVVMRPRDAALTLSDAAAGGTLTGRDGAVLTLPANALVTAAGGAVTGAVQISITPVDPTQNGGGGFPGSFDGLQQNGTTTPIVSFGTTEYVLTAAGQPVQVAPGKRATIELPLYGTKRVNGTLLAAGDSTPLWSLDESTGAWVQEGTGVVVASATSPSGFALRAAVTHFTWWNSDIGFEPYGPKPKCIADPDIGIPGANNTFVSATICNMLAEFDRGLPSPRVVSGSARQVAVATAAAEPRFAGFSVRRTLPIAGGVTIPVPAGTNIALRATALNGTWGGSAVVNGAVGVQAEVLILMRPLVPIVSQAPEAITLPFDGTRTVPPQQSTLSFTFAGTAQRYARVVLSQSGSAAFIGRVRVLQGATVIGSLPVNGAATLGVLLPASVTYTIDVVADQSAPFRMQVDLVGGVQEEALTLPVNISRTIAPYTSYRGTFTTAAPLTMYLARSVSNSPVDLRVLSPTGAVLLDPTTLPDTALTASVTLPAAGAYVIEVRPRNPTAAAALQLQAAQAAWAQVAPVIDQSGVFQIIDAQVDKNGKVVVGYVDAVGTASRIRLQRWTGTAWEAAAGDLLISAPCGGGGNGASSAAFAFDSSNRAVVLTGGTSGPAGSSATIMSAQRFTGGAWEPIGPNNGTLPLRSAFGGACASAPAVTIAADGSPAVAYGYDNSIVVQRFDGTRWRGAVAADTSGDVFPLQNGTYDIKVDAQNRLWFVTGSPTFSGVSARVRRFNAATSAWDFVGGALPQPNTLGLDTPRLRFDAAGLPVIGWQAAVGANGVAGGGVAVYRFDGTNWSTTGGYVPTGTRTGQGLIGFTLVNGEALLSWSSISQLFNSSGIVVQRNTATGWTPVGSGAGEVPQFNVGTVNTIGSYSSRLVSSGSEVYLVLISQPRSGGAAKLVLMRRLPN